MKELLENSLKYRQWVETLQKNNIAISRVEPLNLIHKKSGELLFALLSIDAKAPNGEKLLPIALVRGHFVSVAVILIERETQEKYVLLVRQYRIASGEYTYEHPAGMCDSSTDIWQVAIKEIAEETGLQIEKSQLHLLNEKPLYTSPGLLDEGGYLFFCEIELSRTEIECLADQKVGVPAEKEFITTYVCKLDEAWQLMNNMTSYLNLLLYVHRRNYSL